MFKKIVWAISSFIFFVSAQIQSAELIIDSWRIDDIDLWKNSLIPAFNQQYPDIKVTFRGTNATDYDDKMTERFDKKQAGDLITCRPFDGALQWFEQGHLTPLDDLSGMSFFRNSAKVAWQTDDGDVTFCLPMASVIHGFLYNKDKFSELNLRPPTTVDDFFKLADQIKQSSDLIPIALGTQDKWETHQIVYTSIGANYWRGEQGRFNLLTGSAKFTDNEYQQVFEQMAQWRPYLGEQFQSRSYHDSQALFANQQALILPAGSWDIAYLERNIDFEMGVFKPVVQQIDDKCYISDHTDIAIGINSASKNKKEAKILLNWMASKEFSKLFSHQITGFFPLSSHKIKIDNPIANEMMQWRQLCHSTIRLNAQIMNRGTPSMEQEFWQMGVEVINGTTTPKAAVKHIQEGFEAWYY